MQLDFIYDIIALGSWFYFEQKVTESYNIIYFMILPKLKQLRKASTITSKVKTSMN